MCIAGREGVMCRLFICYPLEIHVHWLDLSRVWFIQAPPFSFLVNSVFTVFSVVCLPPIHAWLSASLIQLIFLWSQTCTWYFGLLMAIISNLMFPKRNSWYFSSQSWLCPVSSISENDIIQPHLRAKTVGLVLIPLSNPNPTPIFL